MLGRHSPQGELFRPDSLHLDHVGRDSFYGFLAASRHRLFRDRDFADLYRKDWGRPSVPPSQLCIALLLQAKDGVSDEEAIQRSAFDLRWKVALGIEMEDKLCAKSTLQLFRAKLVIHEKYQDLFQASVDACRREGLLKAKKLEVAIDTTPVFGRGAVKDTFNLISDQIRSVVKEIVLLKGLDRDEFVAQHGLGRHFGKSLKGQVEIDWSDPDQKRALVAQLVADANVVMVLVKAALRGFAKNSDKTVDLRSACELLADLLLQDIDEDPDDGGGPQITRGTKKDRIVSTTDPEMRHGRKSHSKTFDGYKASVVADTDDGVILATDVRQGNVHDSAGAPALVVASGKTAKRRVDCVLGDTAYGGMETRKAMRSAVKGIEIVAKVQPATKRKGVEFSVEDFEIDLVREVATCPADKPALRCERPQGARHYRFVFSRNDCRVCPIRTRCTQSRGTARVVTVTEGYEELRELRIGQRTNSFKNRYRTRTRIEHRIARIVQLGSRQARYFGRSKVTFQIAIAATVANLDLASRKAA